jgi:hypothetical protein
LLQPEPDRFELSVSADGFRVVSPAGKTPFRGRASAKGPKLYVFSVDGQVVYVGITKQALRTRLRYGWTAQGRGGYYGYRFRHSVTAVSLWVWYATDPLLSEAEIETVEAELVYLVRASGQWPQYQTEIRFHQSTDAHRTVAASVLEKIRAAS